MLSLLLPELQEEIFYYCHASSLKNLSCCNHLYKELCREWLWHTVKIQYDDLSSNDYKDDKRVELLRYTHVLWLLQHIDFNESTVTRNCISFSQHCSPKALYTKSLPRDVYTAFVRFDKLVKLSCDCYWKPVYPTDETLSSISKILSLKELILNPCKVASDIGINHLTSLVNLEIMTLEDCQGITDLALSQISKMATLKRLGITFSLKITDNGINHLVHLVELEALDIHGCLEVTDAGLSIISKMALKELNVSTLEKITDKGISYLMRMVNLEMLFVHYCQGITDVALSFISKITSLKELRLSNRWNITDEGVRHFSSLLKLEVLNISDCRLITDSGLLHISKIRSLKDLYINHCSKITKIGVNYFSSSTAVHR